MGQTENQIPDDYVALIEALAAEDSKASQELLAASREDQRLFVVMMARWLDNEKHLMHKVKEPMVISWLGPTLGRIGRVIAVKNAMLRLLRRRLPFRHDDVVALLTWLGNQTFAGECGGSQMIKVVQDYLEEHSLTPEIQEGIENAATILESGYGNTAKTRRWATRLRELGNPDDASLSIVAGEAWSDVAIQDIEAMDGETRSTWIELIDVCANASGSKPTAKWSRSAGALLEKVGFDSFRQGMVKWFSLVDKPRTQAITSWEWWQPDPNYLLHERNADILKGMAWLCAGREDREVVRALTTLALAAYRKIPCLGPRSVKIGNACVWALGQIPGLESVGQLALLKIKVKYSAAQKSIAKALTKAAERAGLPQEEIEEMSVPAYGMETVGIRREMLGEFTVEVVVMDTASVQLRWTRPDGTPQKSVPKAVKENHAAELKELKQAVKDIRTMIPVQRSRIESMYLQQKRWDFATWRERYLDHPLVGTLARRLIWQFSDGDRAEAGIWHDDRLVAHDGTALDWLSDSAQVELWHPIGETVEAVTAWRDWLVEHEVRQPFKQAHREIYVLTDAERDTRVYSNRFAAHIIKQHQFNALCGARGWKNKLKMLMVDDLYPSATRLIPSWGLLSEFWVEGVGDTYGVDTTEANVFLYLTTDQVRFYAIDAREPIPLEEVPPLVFTEVMRDVDLFVGVASIGNDPTWIDGGPEVAHYTYWQVFSFGDLSEAAKTRKQVLEQLIPTLEIADRCELEGRFLIVRGDIRTYKIHLGSSNIRMTPNDQYLCIVPAQGAARDQVSKVFLPFEGDTTLALILSKALLLAEDKKIKDRTILRQIT